MSAIEWDSAGGRAKEIRPARFMPVVRTRTRGKKMPQKGQIY